MVLIARKGLRSGAVLAESQPTAIWDSGSGSDPAPMSGHGATSLRRGHLWITHTPKRMDF
jgi:hypothetical protein